MYRGICLAEHKQMVQQTHHMKVITTAIGPLVQHLTLSPATTCLNPRVSLRHIKRVSRKQGLRGKRQFGLQEHLRHAHSNSKDSSLGWRFRKTVSSKTTSAPWMMGPWREYMMITATSPLPPMGCPWVTTSRDGVDELEGQGAYPSVPSQ